MAPENNRRMSLVLAAIQGRLDEAWRVEDLAAVAQLSPSRFAHVFRRAVGMAPRQYLRQLRMERARELLQDTDCSVAAVMRSIGYRDPSRFSRDFRRRFGVGPREYRYDHRSRIRR